jgi:uncharacterized YccA/Bax inhibitor family protein
MSTRSIHRQPAERRVHRRHPLLLVAALVAWCAVTGVALLFVATRLFPDLSGGFVLVLLAAFGVISAAVIREVR